MKRFALSWEKLGAELPHSTRSPLRGTKTKKEEKEDERDYHWAYLARPVTEHLLRRTL